MPPQSLTRALQMTAEVLGSIGSIYFISLKQGFQLLKTGTNSLFKSHFNNGFYLLFGGIYHLEYNQSASLSFGKNDRSCRNGQGSVNISVLITKTVSDLNTFKGRNGDVIHASPMLFIFRAYHGI